MKVKVLNVRDFEDLIQILTSMSHELKCENRVSDGEKGNVQSTEHLDYFLGKIADKKGWSVEKTVDWINSINEICPIAAFNIIVREIAIYLDKKYKDHIEKSENTYVISPLDGRIHSVAKKHIKNYRNFAAFRSIEDAKFACKILRDPLKHMFRSAKGK